MKKLKRYYLTRLIATVLFGIGVGALLYVLSPYANEIFDILVIAMGLLTAVFNLPALLIALSRIGRRGEWINFAVAALSILLGVALMLLQTDFLLLLLGAYSVVLPLVRILLVENRRERFKHEVPRFLTGLVMVVIFLTEAEEWVLRVGAAAAVGISLIYLVYGLVLMHFAFSEKKTETGVREPQ